MVFQGLNKVKILVMGFLFLPDGGVGACVAGSSALAESPRDGVEGTDLKMSVENPINYVRTRKVHRMFSATSLVSTYLSFKSEILTSHSLNCSKFELTLRILNTCLMKSECRFFSCCWAAVVVGLKAEGSSDNFLSTFLASFGRIGKEGERAEEGPFGEVSEAGATIGSSELSMASEVTVASSASSTSSSNSSFKASMVRTHKKRMSKFRANSASYYLFDLINIKRLSDMEIWDTRAGHVDMTSAL